MSFCPQTVSSIDMRCRFVRPVRLQWWSTGSLARGEAADAAVETKSAATLNLGVAPTAKIANSNTRDEGNTDAITSVEILIIILI